MVPGKKFDVAGRGGVTSVYAAKAGRKGFHFRGKRASRKGYSRACVDYRPREISRMASGYIFRLKGVALILTDSDQGRSSPPTSFLNAILQPPPAYSLRSTILDLSILAHLPLLMAA